MVGGGMILFEEMQIGTPTQRLLIGHAENAGHPYVLYVTPLSEPTVTPRRPQCRFPGDIWRLVICAGMYIPTGAYNVPHTVALNGTNRWRLDGRDATLLVTQLDSCDYLFALLRAFTWTRSVRSTTGTDGTGGIETQGPGRSHFFWWSRFQ
ncbi:hypothetical protein BDY21DRAFT_16671 [Lineolata rhizophorae]|uniref:Uncharacterized protein n=1 Tax=Lineolata rhizophorae TaxID=578093 RepID=A0A6A6P181_9PEZI|nr:hypothetical protein BDY21DRAFT_16671 [Lineolata rhizophorae]